MTEPNSPTFKTTACAKINLALSVGPPQPPRGYHPIASWFVPIALCDDLSVTPLPPHTASRFTIAWAVDAPKPTPIDWPVEKDLVFRAHALLEQAAGRPLPVAVELRKRIPVGGGLGGGSSDAAAMFRAGNRVFALGLSRDELAAMAMTLGSDIAYFLDADERGELRPTSRPAMVTGLGERIERTATVRGSVLLLAPPFGCPTGAVYRAYDRSPRPLQAERVRALIAAAERADAVPSGELFNDLAEPACIAEPRLAEVLDRLRRGLGVPVHVTGSGSTMFVVDPPAGSIGRAKAAAPDVVAVATRMV